MWCVHAVAGQVYPNKALYELFCLIETAHEANVTVEHINAHGALTRAKP